MAGLIRVWIPCQKCETVNAIEKTESGFRGTNFNFPTVPPDILLALDGNEINCSDCGGTTKVEVKVFTCLRSA
jgi:hypothetical protein